MNNHLPGSASATALLASYSVAFHLLSELYPAAIKCKHKT